MGKGGIEYKNFKKS